MDMAPSSSSSKIWLDGGVSNPGLKLVVSSVGCWLDTPCPCGFNVDLEGEVLA